MISSRIKAIATTKINNSVNTFPPYVILVCSAIFHIALKIFYHKEALMKRVKKFLSYISFTTILTVIFMIYTKLILWIGIFILILIAIYLLIFIIKSLHKLK